MVAGDGVLDASKPGWQVSIRSLELQGQGLRDLSPLSLLTALEEASYSGNRLGDSTPLALPPWPSIRSLDLSVSS